MSSFSLRPVLLLLCSIICIHALPASHDATLRSVGRMICPVEHASASMHFNLSLKSMHQSDQAGGRRLQTRQEAMLVIDTFVHIIADQSSAASVTNSTVLAQINVLNEVYNAHSIGFRLIATDWTINDDWAVAAGADMLAAKQALRRGSYSSLNLYFHTKLIDGNLGTCTLPSFVPNGANSSIYISDGCNIHAGTMPGGLIWGYNLGMTAVHEVGHWFGLLHTFESWSCEGDGDYIADTRQESVPTNGCPDSPPKNTCPQLPGVDPIHNYMDYSVDACYNSFTPLQARRMHDMWAEHRSST